MCIICIFMCSMRISLSKSVYLSSNCFDYFISLKRLSLKILNPSSNQQTAKSKFWLALYSEDCEVTSLFMSVDVQISTDHV